jgi:hypothetical protein
MKISVRKIGSRWQPVDSFGHVVRGDVYNADGTGYSTREGAAEAAQMLRASRSWRPHVPQRAHATKKTSEEASAGFAVHIDHEDVIKDNARERFGPDYGDAAERDKAMKAGLVDAQGKITDRGWELLNKDSRILENNALTWLRKTFGRASDQGHDSSGDLIGGLSFNPRSVKQAHNIYLGAREGRQERIDFSDTGYGDFAGSGAWKGVSNFGQDVLGGHITFFDVQPPEAIQIAEETTDRAAEKRRATRRR